MACSKTDHPIKAGASSPPRKAAPIWVSATGTLKTRIKKAQYYLRRSAWVPTDPKEGDSALLVVACNLRRYHQLCESTSLALIRENYNPRCKTANGASWAWDDQGILKKYRQAGRLGMYPTLGVTDPKAKAKAVRVELHRQVKAFFKKHVVPGGVCTPAEFREAFVRFRGGEDVTPNMLSRVIKALTGREPVRPFGKKFYRGFHIAETHLGLIQDTTQKEEQIA